MFKGLGNIGNIASMVGALQKLPEKLQELNEQMKAETVTGKSADGQITVLMNGTGEVQSVSVEGELADQELEQAILEATNMAGAAAKQLYASSISKMVEDMDLNLPGMEGVLSNLAGGG